MMLYCDCGCYFEKNKFIIKDMKTNKIICRCTKSQSYSFDEFEYIRKYRKTNP